MNINTFLILVIIVCSCIFFAGFAGEKKQFIWRVATRGIGGCAMIWAVGFVLNIFEMQSPVGLNGWTASVSAVFGMPGIMLLYAIGIYASI